MSLKENVSCKRKEHLTREISIQVYFLLNLYLMRKLYLLALVNNRVNIINQLFKNLAVQFAKTFSYSRRHHHHRCHQLLFSHLHRHHSFFQRASARQREATIFQTGFRAALASQISERAEAAWVAFRRRRRSWRRRRYFVTRRCSRSSPIELTTFGQSRLRITTC